MKVLNLVQGTADWFAWRRGGITSTDATVLAGMGAAIDPKHPITALDLVAEKLGIGAREETFAMRRGRVMESPARSCLEERTGLVLRPACVQHDSLPWLRASLDGLTFLEDVLAEIKCPKILDHECALAGMVPHHYRPQVQYQLLVTGLSSGLYASYSTARCFGGPERPSLAVVEIEADAELQAQLLDVAGRFAERVRRCLKAGRLVA